MFFHCQGLVYLLLIVQFDSSLTQLAIHGDGRDGPFNPIIAKTVSCGENHFHVHLQFKFPFYGVVRSEDSQCIYIDGLSGPRREYDLTVPLDRCATTRTVNSDTNHVEYRNKLQILRQPGSIDGWSLSYTLYCLQYVGDRRSRDDGNGRESRASMDRIQVHFHQII